MSIPGRAEAAVKGLALAAGIGIVILAILLTSFGFLIAGFFFWIERYKSHDIAAAITGGGLLLIALLIGIIGPKILKKMKKPQPPLLAEFTGIFGTAGRIAGLLIRKDPRKSLVLAVIAGAIAEYVTSGDKRKR
jgi:hypothetical protein